MELLSWSFDNEPENLSQIMLRFLINTGTTQVLFLNYSFLIKYTGKL